MKVVLFVAAILFAIGCLWWGKQKQDQYNNSRQSNTVLQKENKQLTSDYDAYKLQSDSNFGNAITMVLQYADSAKKSKSKLDQANGTIKGLLQFIDHAANQLPDSTFIAVSPDYKLGCDSLRQANAGQLVLIDQYEHDNQAHVDALNYETGIRDSALQKERQFNERFRLQLIQCSLALSNCEKTQRSPGNYQVYAGMAAWGNSLNPIGGGEINLGLKTKSDQFYEIKGAYLGKWWVGAGAKFKIHF